MLLLIKKNKWVIIAVVLVVTAMTLLTGYIYNRVNQAATLTIWVTRQQQQLLQIGAALQTGTRQNLEQARAVAAQLDQSLEQAYAGLTDLALTEEMQLAVKMWQMPVTRLRQLLEQNNAENTLQQAQEWLAAAQQEGDKVLRNAQQQAGMWQQQAAAARSAAIWLTVLSGLGVLGVWLVFQRRYAAKEQQMQETLAQEGVRNQMLTDFIEAISSGNYQVELAGTHDAHLAEKLRHMRDKLRTSAEEEARRNRAATGLAQIGEILRSTQNASELYDRIIKFVVNFTNSNQGGLFLLRREEGQEAFLELVSAYAFERKKYITKKIDTGQGLVGQCFVEAQSIFLAKVPDNYIHITSGLGEANPNCILLVPLKTEDTVLGVIELATFTTYDAHEIELIEKFAQSIAATLANVQINENTRLLLEQTQQQAEEMRAQEEEMRQNMEELAATQEELARKEQEYIRRIRQLEEQLGAQPAPAAAAQNRV
jgi:putative methionine-R-sulfoxide reductase with GAF domain